MSDIRVYYWREDGEMLGTTLVESLPVVGDCLHFSEGPMAVVQRWFGKASEHGRPNDPAADWHIVLRPADSPSEQVPPWEREDAQ